MSAELTRLSIGALQRAYAAGEIRVADVVDAYLDRVAALDPALEAYVTVTADQARAQAQALDRDGYRADRPLYGVPVAPKDLYWTAGVRTTAGSRLLAEWVPTEDATAVSRMAAAGAISLGKLNTHEFAFGGTTQTWERKTKNPWDRTRGPGGSSGGSGAALAADLCAGTVVTDTGGSSRIPAHCCGVVGLKPTFGRVSRFGVIPLSWNLDHAAPMARTVEDAAALLQVIAGPDPRDAASLAQPPLPDLLAAEPSARGLRVGVPRALIEELSSDEVRRAFDGALRVLAREGAVLEEVELFDFGLAEGAQWVIITADATAYHRPTLQTRAGEYGEDVRNLLLAGERLSAPDYVRAQQIRRLMVAHFREVLARVDVIALPVMSTVAPPLVTAASWGMDVNGRELPMFTIFTGFCLYANLTGLPSVAMPCDVWGDGMPVDIQLMGRAWDEATLVRAGRAYQRAIDWEARRPVFEKGA